MSNVVFLHIPKTGGTALKYLSRTDQARLGFSISRAHRVTFDNSAPSRVVFGIRDPWQRFCSGYWERVTMTQRRDYYEQHMKPRKVEGFGYSDLRHVESETLKRFPTPDSLITQWRTNFVAWGNQDYRIPLWEIIAPITHWTGDLQFIRCSESRIHMVYEVSDMTKVFRGLYQVEMPQDPFRRRSRELFDIEQSYDATEENLDWFRTVFRPEDYAVIDYLRTRPYYQNAAKAADKKTPSGEGVV